MDIEVILQAGEKHFFAKQYNDVKLDNIANELGIKKPSLYYYFTNKRDYYIKTLKYSMKKYITALREVIEKNDLEAFIGRYLDYPSKHQNLFAIAAQKWYGDDREINGTIEVWKQVINTEIEVFLTEFEMEPITMYLICQLLDKLAVENCIDGYCLEYNIKDLTKELTKLIQKK